MQSPGPEFGREELRARFSDLDTSKVLYDIDCSGLCLEYGVNLNRVCCTCS